LISEFSSEVSIMLRELRDRLNPETISWAVGFSLLEFGVASCLGFLGVGGGLIVAWMLVAGGVFAVNEPGLFAWLWVMVISHNEEDSPPEKTPPPDAPSDSPTDPSESKEKGDSKSSDGTEANEPDAKLIYAEKLARLIRKPSSKTIRVAEVLVALALAFFTYFGAHWTPGKVPTPDQIALQRSVDQLHQELKDCKENLCGDKKRDGGNPPPQADPKFKQDVIDAIKEAVKNSTTSWTGPSIFGVSLLVLLLIGLGVALVLMFRKSPETAAPLGAVGLAATAIKEAEHLSRLDMSSFRFAEWAFIVLLGIFALLACWKIWISFRNHVITSSALTSTTSATPPTRSKPENEGKSKIESPLSLFFSALVLLWALLVICYRQKESIPVQPPAPISSELLLPPITGFIAGNSKYLDKNRILEQVTQQTIQKHKSDIKPEDLLLLLGSADCTAVRKSLRKTNGDFASERADEVTDIVKGMKLLPEDHVIPMPLYQHESCKESADLRAVFPVLIKAEKSGAAVR
jgi:hypothetical protein